MRWLTVWCAIGSIAVACSSSPDPTGDPGDSPDAGTSGDPDAGGDGDGTLPAVPELSGIVYVGNFLSNELSAFRIDGDAPAALAPVELGNPTHDMDIDPVNSLLAVVSDVGRTATVFRVSRPASPEAAAPAPEQLAVIPFDTRPVFTMLSPYRQQLVVASAPTDGGPLESMLLHVYDLTDPTRPEELAASPFSIPVTTSLALDPVRSVLFLVELKTDRLRAYDVTDKELVAVPGEPVALTAMFPQENSAAFQARNLTVDPWRNRLYAARAQTVLSELIAFDYPAAIPRGGARYGNFASMDELALVADPFDVDQPHDQRPNLLGGYAPAVDAHTGEVLMSADAWNGQSATAILVGMSSELELARGCDDFEGFGCWYRKRVGSEPGPFALTDGALCVDHTRRIAVGTSVSGSEQSDPGNLHLFRYDGDLAMEPLLPAGGGDLVTGKLPVDAVCF